MIQTIKIEKVTIYSYSLPFKSPLDVGGKRLKRREGFVLGLRGSGGFTGYGEVAPLEGFSRETVKETGEQLREVARELRGTNIHIQSGFPGLSIKDELKDKRKVLYPSLRFGLETAAVELLENELGKKFPFMVTDEPVERVRVNGLLYGAGDKMTEGFGTFKIKVGRDGVEEDIKRINEILWEIPPGVVIRLDANGLWSLREALEFGKGLNKGGIEKVQYIEEPFKEPAHIRRFYHETGLGVALDESLQETDFVEFGKRDFDKNPFPEGVKALVLKPTVLGGVERTLDFISMAGRYGMMPVMSSCFEAGPGFRQLVKLAATVNFVESAAGLDTLRYLEASLFSGGVTMEKGRIDWAGLPRLDLSKLTPLN